MKREKTPILFSVIMILVSVIMCVWWHSCDEWLRGSHWLQHYWLFARAFGVDSPNIEVTIVVTCFIGLTCNKLTVTSSWYQQLFKQWK